MALRVPVEPSDPHTAVDPYDWRAAAAAAELPPVSTARSLMRRGDVIGKLGELGARWQELGMVAIRLAVQQRLTHQPIDLQLERVRSRRRQIEQRADRRRRAKPATDDGDAPATLAPPG